MNRSIFAVLFLAATLSAQLPESDFIPEPEVSPVPEPTTYMLMAAGLGAIAYSRHRFTKKK